MADTGYLVPEDNFTGAPVDYTEPLRITVRPPSGLSAPTQGWGEAITQSINPVTQSDVGPAQWPTMTGPMPLAAPGTQTPEAAPGTAAPALGGRYGDLISRYAAQYGIDPRLMSRIMQIESGGDPYNVTGSYRGLFQLGPEEWKRYGRGNVFDPEANAAAAAAKVADEIIEFRRDYGRDPTPTEIYLTHQQGAGGLARHMENPEAPAWTNMLNTAEGRQKGEKWAKAAIWGNIPDAYKRRFGSVDNVSSAAFASIWREKIEGEGATYSPMERSVASYSPEERAAARVRRGVQSTGGRDEGPATRLMAGALPGALNFVQTLLRANAEKPAHYGEALGKLLGIGERNLAEAQALHHGRTDLFTGGPGFEAATSVIGGTPVGAPRLMPGEVALGAGPIRPAPAMRTAEGGAGAGGPQIPTAPVSETVASTALVDRAGNIFPGATPGQAFEAAVAAGAKPQDLSHVFVTSTGRIIGPDEARTLAGQSGQVAAGHPSEYLRPEDLHGQPTQAAEPAAAPGAGLQPGQPDLAGGGLRPGEGGAGGIGSLEAAQRAAAAARADARPLTGLPEAPLKIGEDWFVPGPDNAVKKLAEQYNADKGLGPMPETYATIDVPRAERIAQAYEDMPHAPNDPKVKASYDAMINETIEQYKYLERLGVRFEAIPPNAPDPYAASPRLANKDFRENKHLWYFPTESGFGTGPEAAAAAAGNPLLRPAGVHDSTGRPMLANDVFRVVHDVFGHFKEGVGFRAAGEENAWRSHSAMYSDAARPAMTSETRGQNSWLNYGPYGAGNRTAKSADTQYAQQKTGLLPDWVVNEGRGDFTPVKYDPFIMEEYPGIISTRLPTAKGAHENPFETKLTIDADAMRADPDLYKHNVGMTRNYLNMTERESRLPVEQAAKAFHDHVVNNLLWLYDRFPEALRDRAMQWYDGANKIANFRAEQYGIPPNSIAGVYAGLSPQKDWFMNVSLGDRVLDAWVSNQNTRLEPAMIEQLPPWFHEEKQAKLKEAISGKTLAEMPTPEEKAFWIRAYDQTHNEPTYQIISPEGGYMGHALKKDGTPAKVTWGFLDTIITAVESLQANGNVEAISRAMGDKHKVRNFFNNILHPNAPHDVTIDTHAVAAALLRPFSGSAPEVAHSLHLSGPKGSVNPKKSSLSGVSGLYGLYADAYRAAAEARGILPRQMQSVTWEAIRGLYSPVFKRNSNSQAAIQGLWEKYRKGEMTIDQVRDGIFEIAGGIDQPSWATGSRVGEE